MIVRIAYEVLACDCCCISYPLIDVSMKMEHFEHCVHSFVGSFFGTNCAYALQVSGECLIDELLLYDTADSIVLPIFSRFGGLRSMGSLSSAFLLVPTAFFFIFT